MPVEVPTKSVVTKELPEKLTPKNVQYYSHHTKQLAHSQVYKAMLFVLNKCIRYDEFEQVYFCDALKGYNTRNYRVEKKHKGFECSCQACNKKIREGKYNPEQEELAACSHILALYYYFKIKHWNKKE